MAWHKGPCGMAAGCRGARSSPRTHQPSGPPCVTCLRCPKPACSSTRGRCACHLEADGTRCVHASTSAPAPQRISTGESAQVSGEHAGGGAPDLCVRYSSRQPAVLPASCAALPSPPSPRVLATSARAAPRARLRHLTSGPPAPHAVAVRTYLGCQRIFGMKVCLSCSSESRNSKHLFAIVLHIYFRARKAAVSTFRRDAGEEGVSTFTGPTFTETVPISGT